jgi:hypothetical protein
VIHIRDGRVERDESTPRAQNSNLKPQ